ncbi:MAG: helix-turn-helix domain-containing protein [Hyphomicrobiales bacterium]|nr:helix-turn-helix domain-containing protein [Hyphomicrobiales bacterium]
MTDAPQIRRPRGRPRSTGPGQPSGSVQSLDRALALLKLVAASDGIGLTDLSQRAGIAPSTAHRLLTTLQAHGFVDYREAQGHWLIGVEAFRAGSAFVRRTKVADMGRAVMRRLMESCGETVNLAIEQDGDVVFISQVETHEPIRAFFRPGTRGPAHASGIGKALLAEHTDETVRRLLQRKGLPGFTPKTIVEPERLFGELAEIRRRGWSLDDEERNLGMRCVAAAIYNEFGEAIAGVSISGPVVRLSDERVGELGPRVKRAAAEITESIGGTLPERTA